MIQKNKILLVFEKVEEVYKKTNVLLPFHGWHHINFVYKKSIDFVAELNADPFIVSVAALTHDLNYVVKINSDPEVAKNFRKHLLRECALEIDEINRVENVIYEAHTAYRDENISSEAKALSDADTLFKALPITPILFANLYAIEQDMDIFTLAKKIIKDQNRLIEEGIYFYSGSAKKYLGWAETNLELWKNVIEFFNNSNLNTFKEDELSLIKLLNIKDNV